jgi:hypothetical protein
MNIKGLGYKMEYLNCDNARENKNPSEGLYNEYESALELTAPDTLQQNSDVVERRIALLQQHVNVM